MKIDSYDSVRLLAMTCFLAAAIASASGADASEEEFRYAVKFELGETEFAPGDSISIGSVRGTKDTLTAGGTYCVEGTYTLHSRDEAELALFVTTTAKVSTPIDPRQTLRVSRGAGSFRLIATITTEGYPHVSFYPATSGSAFGGVYFGVGNSVLHSKGFSYFDKSTVVQAMKESSLPIQVLASGPNRAIFEYLGAPVAPPQNMDPAYSSEGLTNAITLASQRAGLKVKHIEVDNSEFPFILGVVYEKVDQTKLMDQIRTMPKYAAQGGVSSESLYVMNITPWNAYPSESAQRVGRRLSVRQHMLYDKIGEWRAANVRE